MLLLRRIGGTIPGTGEMEGNVYRGEETSLIPSHSARLALRGSSGHADHVMIS